MSRQRKKPAPANAHLVHLVSDAEKWEPMFVACLVQSKAMMESVSGVLCVDTENKERTLDLEILPLNAIYLACRRHMEVCTQAKAKYTAPPVLLLKGYLSFITEKEAEPCGLSPSGIQAACDRYSELLATYPAGTYDAIVGLAMPLWFGRKKFAQAVNNTSADTLWTPADFFDRISSAQKVIPGAVGPKRSFSPLDLMFKTSNKDVRLRTGIVDLDRVLNGGWARGTAAIGLAPSGAGKTVMSCMMAGNMLMSNGPKTKGLLITTEQPAVEMLPRIMCAQLGIRFTEDLAVQFSEDLVTPEEWRKAMRLAEHMHNRLVIEDWESKDTSTTFRADVMARIDNFLGIHGHLDFLVFDWLGSSLNDKIAGNEDQMRVLYKAAADTLCKIASEMNIHVQFYAQADTMKTIGKKYVGPEDASECKSMHVNASYGFGLSALKISDGQRGRHGDSDEDERQAKGTYKDEQYMNFFKMRKGRPMILPIWRDMEHQRFLFSQSNKARMR